MFDKQDLVTIANMAMPFGKYRGRLLIDLPEPYLLWFANKGFPAGRLGMLLALTLAMFFYTKISELRSQRLRNAAAASAAEDH